MKLYVGTYAKYAAGSIAGRWMDLDKFKRAEEFEAACRKLHGDERDPELMFQDVEMDPGEDWQEGLYSESRIPRDYWRMKAEREAEKKAAKARKMTPDEQRQEELFSQVWEEAVRCGIEREGDKKSRDNRRKEAARLVRLEDGGIVEIDRPRIETQFPFGEDDRGQGEEEPGSMKYALKQCANVRTKNGFISRNLADFDKGAEWTNKSEFSAKRWWKQADEPKPIARELVRVDPWKPRDKRDLYPLTPRDRANIRAAVARVRTDFLRRLETWWKRFGAEHVHAWTYWTEA